MRSRRWFWMDFGFSGAIMFTLLTAKVPPLACTFVMVFAVAWAIGSYIQGRTQ